MDREYIKEINRILSNIDIDARVKPLIKLYFLGKLKLKEITLEELSERIAFLCSKISNVEFSSNNIVSAYSKKANVLTINKKLFLERRADEVILPVFMKFEQATKLRRDRAYYNYIEDFIRAGKTAKACNVPIQSELHKIYQLCNYVFRVIMYKKERNETYWGFEEVCNDFNKALNNIIVTGTSNTKDLISLASFITGCPKQTILSAKFQNYVGNSRISDVLCNEIKKENNRELTEEFIVNRVQAVIDRKPNWDSRLKPLVVPFFIRSQKIYGWNFDEFQERINQLDLQIDYIKFDKIKNKNVAGNVSENTISLSSKWYLDKNGMQIESFTDTMFHELGHVTDKNRREGIQTKGQTISHTRFYEWTESIFEILSSKNNFYTKDNAMHVAVASYEALGPVGSMVSSALGLSEIEYARIKDKGEEYEEEVLKDCFPKDNRSKGPNGIDVLNGIKNLLERYALYPEHSLKKRIKNQKLLNDIYEGSLYIMQRRIERDLSCNIENMELYRKYQSYFLRKINANYSLASRRDGFIFTRKPISHSIEFCNDTLSKKDLKEISHKFVKIATYNFSNNLDSVPFDNTVELQNKKRLLFEVLQERFSKATVPIVKIVKTQKGYEDYDIE